MSEYASKTSWRWDVHKFGGTSVGNADCMRKCIGIIKPLLANRRMAMVVSAMGGKPKVFLLSFANLNLDQIVDVN
jgi:aspartokinase